VPETDLNAVICNGIPKAGTHALKKGVELLGVQAEHQHTPHADKEDGKQVVIFRHPKNIIMSWVRFSKRQISEGLILGAIQSFEPFAAYDGYLDDDTVLTVRFEDLVADQKELVRISEYIGVDYIDGAFEMLPKHTRTWTGDFSNWEDHWTDRIQESWIAMDGPEVETRWNY
jgi:hypothetical protein